MRNITANEITLYTARVFDRNNARIENTSRIIRINGNAALSLRKSDNGIYGLKSACLTYSRLNVMVTKDNT